MTGYRLALLPPIVFAVAAISAALDLPFREIMIGAFLLVGPGAAITWLAGVRATAAWLALVVPTSLAIDALVATGLAYLGIWSPDLALGVIISLSVVMIALVPFERGARAALITVGLLGALVLVAAELAPEPASSAVLSGVPWG